MIERHLHDVGIECLLQIGDRMTGGRDGRVGRRLEHLGDPSNQRRLEQRFVPLNVDDDLLW